MKPDPSSESDTDNEIMIDSLRKMRSMLKPDSHNYDEESSEDKVDNLTFHSFNPYAKSLVDLGEGVRRDEVEVQRWRLEDKVNKKRSGDFIFIKGS